MNAVRHLIVAWSLATVVLAGAGKLAAQVPVIRYEYEIKAEAITMLGKYVTWPPGSGPGVGKPLTIGVLGQDPFVENRVNQLDAAVAKAKAKGVNIVVLRFDSAADYKPCHILHIASLPTAKSAEKTLPARLAAAKAVTAGTPVLLLGDSPTLTRQGVVANLNYNRATNQIRLELDRKAAKNAGLTFAPQLLNLKCVDITDSP